MYVCMHACMYLCMYVCMHACVYVCKLIDHIFTNNTTVSLKNGLIISDISDHLPIFPVVFGDYLRKDSNSFTI